MSKNDRQPKSTCSTDNIYFRKLDRGVFSMSNRIPLRLTKETDEDKAAYYNKDAANFRQEIINHQVRFFLEQGGKITKLPAYDEAHSWQK